MQISYKIIRWLHAWLGLALALFVLLASSTGTLLIWKEDYVKWITPEAQVNFRPTPEALAQIAEAVEAQFADDFVLNIRFATADFPLTRVTLDGTNYAYVDTTGKVVSRWHMNDRPEEWLYDLHHRLLLDDLGLTIMGVVAVALLVLVILGLASFIPFRRLFPTGIVPRGTSRAALLTSHRQLGVVLSLPLLMMAVTGFLQAFPREVEQWLLEDIRIDIEYSDNMVSGLDTISGEGTGDWRPAMERTLAVFPGARIRSAAGSVTSYGSRVIGVQQPGDWNPNGLSFTYIDPATGHMDLRFDALSVPWLERLYNTAYPIHTGKTGSLAYKLFLTLFGLGVAALSAFGLIGFLKGRFKQSKSLDRQS